MTRTADDQIERLRAIATGNLSDALFELGVTACAVSGPRPLGPSQPRFVGPAFTIQQRPKSNASGPGTTLHFKAIDELAAPGDVVVIDVGGRLDVCTLGGLLARRGHDRGLAGFMVNGCVRDAADILEVGFPVHCLGVSPKKSSVELETASIGEPVTIGGCVITPGDLVVCDDTGAVAIPQDLIDQVLAGAESIAEREERVSANLGRGMSLAAAFGDLTE